MATHTIKILLLTKAGHRRKFNRAAYTCFTRPQPSPPTMPPNAAPSSPPPCPSSAVPAAGSLSPFRGKRPTCQRCDRPAPTCVCPALPPSGLKLPLLTKVLVVQHPLELKKRMIGTVPLMDLVLSNFGISVDKGNLEGDADLLEALEDPRTLLLYPGPGAVDIESLVEGGGGEPPPPRTVEVDLQREQRPPPPPHPQPQQPRTLMVIDGTWSQAGRIARTPCSRRLAVPTVQ